MTSEHVKGVEGSNDIEDMDAPWMEAWTLLWAGRQPGHAQEGKLGHVRSSFVVVQSLSLVQLFVTPWTAARQASLSFTISWACSNSYPLSRWVVPFSCLPSFPASGSFLMRQLFASCGQSIGASASASVLPMNIQNWFPLGLTGLISLQSKELSRVFSNTTVQKHQFFSIQPALQSNSHPYVTTGKTVSSVAQSCPTLCDPMNCSTPGLPVHHQLPEFTQTHVHRVSDAIQPSHPLSSPSPPAFNLSQHQGLFRWISSSYQVAKVLEFQL